MEHIPARHAAKVGMLYPARVTSVAPSYVAFELDLTPIAPGRSPYLGAGLTYAQTLDPEKARNLQPGDTVIVVLINVDGAESHDWVQASLPADAAWLTWNNGTVRRLARRIRETGETILLPILADALEEAGCTDATLLDHCRQPEPDAAEGWIVELLATQE
jgi:hypothetical protein